MFKNCTSLKRAPELPALNLIGNCYREMFLGCSKLSYIFFGGSILEGAKTYTYHWLLGVSETGSFYYTYDFNILAMERGPGGAPVGWKLEKVSLTD